MNRTLTCNNVEKTPEQWGISELSLALVSQDADRLELTFGGMPFDEEVPFSYDSLVTLKEDGVVKFVGRVMPAPRQALAETESIVLTVHGPWQELEETVFKSAWKFDGGDSTGFVSRIIMGQALAGGYQDCAACVTEIFDYVTARELNLQLGSNMGAVQIPFSEVREQSIASLLRRYLAFQPSALTSFDYTTSPPTLNIIDRADAAPVALTIDGTKVTSTRIAARQDLQVPAVEITYLVSAQIEGSTALTRVVDAWPADYAGSARKVATGSFDIDGGAVSSTSQTQVIKCRDLPASWGEDDALWWWKIKNPFLYDATNVKIKWLDTKDNDQADDDSAGYPREIIEGVWQEWMAHLDSPTLKAKQFVVKAEATYTYTDPDNEALMTKTEIINGPFLATDAATGTYHSKPEQDITPGQGVPLGLAKRFYDSLSELQYDGTVTLKEVEASAGAIRPGMVLNLFGCDKRPEWKTMRAQIQQVNIDLNAGRTDITFGPAKHLGLDDLLAILQPIRLQIKPTNANARVSGKSKDDENTVTGASLTPTETGSSASGIYSKMQLASKESGDENKLIDIDVKTGKIHVTAADGSKEIRLYAENLNDGQALQIIELDVCEGGVPMKRKFLCTNPY